MGLSCHAGTSTSHSLEWADLIALTVYRIVSPSGKGFTQCPHRGLITRES